MRAAGFWEDLTPDNAIGRPYDLNMEVFDHCRITFGDVDAKLLPILELVSTGMEGHAGTTCILEREYDALLIAKRDA